MALLQVAKNPNIERSPEITVPGYRPFKIKISYRHLKPALASELAEMMAAASAKYLDEAGKAISLTEAASSYIPVENDEGRVTHIPVLYDWVDERNNSETLNEQFDLLEALMCGTDYHAVAEIVGEEPLFVEWDLKREKDDEESIPMDSDTFDEVLTTAEYFWPVWNDLAEAVGEMTTGKNKSKNSKPSGGSGRGKRRGKLIA